VCLDWSCMQLIVAAFWDCATVVWSQAKRALSQQFPLVFDCKFYTSSPYRQHIPWTLKESTLASSKILKKSIPSLIIIIPIEQSHDKLELYCELRNIIVTHAVRIIYLKCVILDANLRGENFYAFKFKTLHLMVLSCYSYCSAIRDCAYDLSAIVDNIMWF